jgi:hypothetical protein
MLEILFQRRMVCEQPESIGLTALFFEYTLSFLINGIISRASVCVLQGGWFVVTGVGGGFPSRK